MKNIFLIIICSFFFSTNTFANDFCKDKEMIVHIKSHHFKAITDYAKTIGYNENNFGLGLSCDINYLNSFNESVEFGTFYNSYREWAKYISYNLEYPINEHFSVGIKSGITTGYSKVLNNKKVIFAGGISSTINIDKNYSLKLLYVPTIENNSDFISFSFGYKF